MHLKCINSPITNCQIYTLNNFLINIKHYHFKQLTELLTISCYIIIVIGNIKFQPETLHYDQSCQMLVTDTLYTPYICDT